jgi:DNA polymerase-3 subunit chi
MRIDFYHDAPDKLATAVRVTHKAFSQGCRLLVYAPSPAVADAFDRLLWSVPATGFVPHCRADAPLAGETPVLIASRLETIPHGELLLNLDSAVPPGFERFARLIEIVGRDEEDKAPARARFRQYRDGGHDIIRHDLAGH